jgi:hypothetical protein
VRKSHNTFATISAAKAKIALDRQTGMSFDSIQALVSLEESLVQSQAKPLNIFTPGILHIVVQYIAMYCNMD